MLSNTRIVIVSILLTVAAVVSYCCVGNIVDVPIKKSLSTFPTQIGAWKWVDRTHMSDEVRKMLGVDDYIQYDYVSADGIPVNLYVSYFSYVGSRKGYHSPKNCMPGGGWNIIHSEPFKLTVSRSGPVAVEINKMVTQKGAEKEVVFYWYQCRGRIIHSEYMGKIYLVLDSMFKRRSDGAFIRIIAPVQDGQETKAVEYLQDFTRQVIPVLEEYLPGA
ncbi:MAG: exosortase C-terminal domain/associated protein EpsI [Thermodesulfobacteriota bacterium]